MSFLPPAVDDDALVADFASVAAPAVGGGGVAEVTPELLGEFPGVTVFPTQKHAFEHIAAQAQRAAAARGAGMAPEVLRAWAIESRHHLLPQRQLARAATANTNAKLLGMRGGSAEGADAAGASKQTRFFATMRRGDAARLTMRLPVGAVHLYEVIQEGAPCCLYLDVERDANGEWPPPSAAPHTSASMGGVPTSAAMAAGTPGAVPAGWAGVAGLGDIEWDGLQGRLARACACPLGCTHRFDGTATATVLLRELQAFLASELDVTLRVGDCVVLESKATSAANDIATALADPNALPPPHAGRKFSQHYVCHLDDAWCFANNLDAGAVIHLFVAAMRRRAQCEPAIHQVLFYHAEPSPGDTIDAPLRPTPEALEAAAMRQAILGHDDDDGAGGGGLVMATRAVPVLPLRCVIDEAVYTRNRVFRCLHSAKLGKSAGLVVHPEYGVAPTRRLTATRDYFFASLVGYGDGKPLGGDGGVLTPVPPERIEAAAVRLGVPVQSLRPRAAMLAAGLDAGGGPVFQEVTTGTYAAVERAVAFAAAFAPDVRPWPEGDSTGQHSVRIDSCLDRGDTLILRPQGRRYCYSRGREHKSNGVYYVVSCARGTFSQRCFDPDCKGRAGPSRLLPRPALDELVARKGLVLNDDVGAPDAPGAAATPPRPRATPFTEILARRRAAGDAAAAEATSPKKPPPVSPRASQAAPPASPQPVPPAASAPPPVTSSAAGPPALPKPRATPFSVIKRRREEAASPPQA